jgi:hypothetical protein
MQPMRVYPGQLVELTVTVTFSVKYGDDSEAECVIEKDAIRSFRERFAEAIASIHHVGTDNTTFTVKELD